MWFVVIGAVLAVVGIAVAVYSWRVALKQTERAAVAETHALALASTEGELATARARADQLETQFREFLTMLQGAGIVRALADPMTVGPDDLTYQVAAVVDGVPDVQGIDPATLQAALERMAARAFSNDPGAAHPMSRPYMVGSGKLTRTQYERLRVALIEGGYLTSPSGGTASVELTDRGRALLLAVRDGRILVG